MSNPNSSRRSWLSSKLWPLSAAPSKSFSTDLQQSTIATKRLIGGGFSTRPVEIKNISLETIQQLKDCSNNQAKSFSLRKLERLDSVGGSESEPIRSSYPPFRTLDKNNFCDQIMGNKLQKMWLYDGLSNSTKVDGQSSSVGTSEESGSSTSSIARLGSYLHSSLQNLTSKLSNNFSYTAGSAKRVEQFSASVLGDQKTEKSVGAFPIPHMAQITVSCDSGGCSLNCQNIPVLSCIQTALPNSDCAELTLMSPECFNEMQMNSAIKDFLPQDCMANQSDQLSSVGDMTDSNHFSTDVSDLETQCCQKPIGPTSCKNPYIANIFGFEQDSESDNSFESSQLENDTDECCSSSSCEESSESDDEESMFSGCKSYKDISDISSNDESSSDEEPCPWKRVLSSRISWTARRKKRPKVDGHKHLTITDAKSTSGDFSNKTMHAVSEIDFDDFQCESSVSDKETKNTVQRPTCTNSSILYILGDSNNGNESDSEVNNLSCSDSENCWSVEENTSSAPDCNNQTSAKESSDSCELWDYFLSCQSTFMDICSTEVNRPSSSLTLCGEENKATAFKCNPPTQNNEDNNPIKKSRTKVRFDDNVVIHRMVTWSFAYRQARKGGWDAFSRDQVRFRKRISNIEKDIAWCFLPEHREKVFKSSVFK